MSRRAIGLTLVAVGTSLPELATTVMAALRRQADVALGNVIGSNMFNLLGIMGVATLVGPVPVDAQFLTFDLWVMLGAALLMIPLVFFRADITRIWGIGLTGAYAVYVWSLL
jgi:cation:H+ antiporter